MILLAKPQIIAHTNAVSLRIVSNLGEHAETRQRFSRPSEHGVGGARRAQPGVRHPRWFFALGQVSKRRPSSRRDLREWQLTPVEQSDTTAHTLNDFGNSSDIGLLTSSAKWDA
jgi:hypothetical protein